MRIPFFIAILRIVTHAHAMVNSGNHADLPESVERVARERTLLPVVFGSMPVVYAQPFPFNPAHIAPNPGLARDAHPVASEDPDRQEVFTPAAPIQVGR